MLLALQISKDTIFFYSVIHFDLASVSGEWNVFKTCHCQIIDILENIYGQILKLVYTQ